MFVITVVFECHAEQRESFAAALRTQAHNSVTKEQDCLLFDVCSDPDRPNRFFLYEIYGDEAAFDLHLKSEHFLNFDKEVADMVTSKTVERWNKHPSAGA
ncbi:putative quinol monooxygenase [Denitrobaculum tricleocarpae]|uniref:Antibiotic biosynthesis monooxygenase n=1 Tax=Denitrobaculum tricleocarpae TaxID=2591009 RepID=A0A545TU60_9PROT|nr:putative quinol monooxygenase [Denitrobaculum tricleocarpae]TQV80753.1 antibiotic biosynthesis monooxygenase [Denitrobaculum tricleocarpae]